MFSHCNWNITNGKYDPGHSNWKDSVVCKKGYEERKEQKREAKKGAAERAPEDEPEVPYLTD